MTDAIDRASNNARSSSRNRSVQVDVRDVSDTLVRVLGRQLLSSILDQSVHTIQGWAADESVPSAEDARRLCNAYKVYALLSTVEGDATIRAWFMGMNSQLEDASPAEALAADHVRDVMFAARSFVNGA